MTGSGYCLSVHQPYAAAIVAGIKPVEIRSWKTQYRGPLYIHATATWDYTGAKLLEPWMSLLRLAGVQQGGIVGVVELVSVVPYLTQSMFKLQEKYHRCPEGWWRPGLYGWVLGKAQKLKFAPMPGKQGLWKR